jgi:hypothetical protein
MSADARGEAGFGDALGLDLAGDFFGFGGDALLLCRHVGSLTQAAGNEKPFDRQEGIDTRTRDFAAFLFEERIDSIVRNPDNAAPVNYPPWKKQESISAQDRVKGRAGVQPGTGCGRRGEPSAEDDLSYD